jgi:Protein of unknown function (DUF3455)
VIEPYHPGVDRLDSPPKEAVGAAIQRIPRLHAQFTPESRRRDDRTSLTAASTSDDAPPTAARVPPGNRLVAQLDSQGVQVYRCGAGAWAFLEPVAHLHDQTPAAIHFRGPSWESIRDGSLVEAATVASSPVDGSIPELLLQTTRTRGDGVFGRVTYVQRLNTTGGLAPTTACADGQTRGVPYTAEYRFYVKA